MGYGINAEQLLSQYLNGLQKRPKEFLRACEWDATTQGLSKITFQRIHQALGCSIESREIVMNDPENETPYYRDLKGRGGGYFKLICANHEVESRSFEQEATGTV